ncbi:hypothetical protein [uncultured Methanobrevibacter sp.]|uniref:hypothetical protein n=1 Tax=uncultured Methanobrevibacter sp. TaxID=253161 RepID=UPI0025D14B78|nr:hypothetical protein [uncultured Methanobrevibacter sp.]
MENEKYISKKNGKFSIDRIFNDKSYNFGVFNNYDDALERVEYLEEEGWPISLNDKNDESVLDSYGRNISNLEKVDDKIIVFKYINNEKIIFGEFNSVNEAKQIRDNLIANAWESMETNDRSKYAKYITKMGGKFAVNKVYKGKIHNFGYFNTFEEALECREELIANNWGELNIPHQMKYGKYISYNGIMYTIQKMLDDKLHVYGFFNDLNEAKKQRDWLVENNWSRLEVPDDSKRHIHKQGNEYLIYMKLENDLEYFGTYPSLEEAKKMRNKLIENDWSLSDSANVEKISDFIYFDGNFYFIEKEIDNQKRIYGVYKNKNQAISDEKTLKKYDWDGPYAIPTEEYPYGENIVPFDYIFILEKNDNGIKEEIGTYYSFKDVIAAKEEKLANSSNEVDKLIFSVKIGKSYKNRGWSIIRDSTYDLIPKLPYEDECDIIVDGISTTGRLNLLPRIFYDKNDEVVNHLEELANRNPNGRINVELLLNKNANISESEYGVSHDETFNLKNENLELKNSNDELKEILTYMDHENRDYLEKFATISKIIEDLNDIDITIDELSSVYNSELRIKIFDIKDLLKSLDEEMKK